jgi:hypothetical protein
MEYRYVELLWSYGILYCTCDSTGTVSPLNLLSSDEVFSTLVLDGRRIVVLSNFVVMS